MAIEPSYQVPVDSLSTDTRSSAAVPTIVQLAVRLENLRLSFLILRYTP